MALHTFCWHGRPLVPLAFAFLSGCLGPDAAAEAQPIDASPTFWAAPHGSGSGRSADDPFQVHDFFASLEKSTHCGGTLVLRDGTYRGPRSTIEPPAGLSGCPGSPIVVRAEHEGRVFVSGEDGDGGDPERAPIAFSRNDWWVLEGFDAKESNAHVARIANGSDHVTLRRMVLGGARTRDNGNFKVLEITWGGQHVPSNDAHVEDVAVLGPGRYLVNVFRSDRATLRRVFAYYTDYPARVRGGISLYHSDDSLVENAIVTMDPASQARGVIGIFVHANKRGETANHNRFIGNLVYGMSGTSFELTSRTEQILGNRVIDTALLRGRGLGFLQDADSELFVRRLTVADHLGSGFKAALRPQLSTAKARRAGFELGLDLEQSLFVRTDRGLLVRKESLPGESCCKVGRIHVAGNGYFHLRRGALGGDAEFGPGDRCGGAKQAHCRATPPALPLERYGRVGGYLFGTTIDDRSVGARVIERSEDGERTSSCLWPWPMEERIAAAAPGLIGHELSVTWAARGGVWATLEDVCNSAGSRSGRGNRIAADATRG